jgi:predicted GNAT family N-acyltransferase
MNKPIFSIIQAQWAADKESLQSIRAEVFVKEQSVPQSLEWDNRDAEAFHAMALDDQLSPIGTGRLLSSGQIGRMAVLKPWRNKGVGSGLLMKIIHIARVNHIAPFFLNAQHNAIHFYQYHGFHPVGQPFNEAGIPHQRMEMD